MAVHLVQHQDDPARVALPDLIDDPVVEGHDFVEQDDHREQHGEHACDQRVANRVPEAVLEGVPSKPAAPESLPCDHGLSPEAIDAVTPKGCDARTSPAGGYLNLKFRLVNSFTARQRNHPAQSRIASGWSRTERTPARRQTDEFADSPRGPISSRERIVGDRGRGHGDQRGAGVD
jgi:hypothetical protein